MGGRQGLSLLAENAWSHQGGQDAFGDNDLLARKPAGWAAA
jgi:hypothetical protein